MNLLIAACGLAAAMTGNVSGAVHPHKAETMYHFSFSPDKTLPGYRQVHATDIFTDARGFGFEPSPAPIQEINRGGENALESGYCTSAAPFSFSVALPEGNYSVTLFFGDRTGPSSVTVKSEVRRLMLPLVTTQKGQFVSRTITVNVRTPELPDGKQVMLKPREITDEYRNWDNKLTLEFSNARPCLDAIKIIPVDVPTIYIAGDSTVTDQGDEPWSGWGQILPSLFEPGISVANYAESGETLRSFAGSGRLAKIMSVIKPGDWLFIQFAHNDMKEHGPGVGPYTTFEDSLRQFIDAARAKGATPVLLTPMNRRSFDSTGHIVNTFITTGANGGDYVDAIRQVALKQKVTLIDLNAMSASLFNAMGPEGTLKAFVHYPANTFPGQTAALSDNTHFNIYGAFELARCVANGIVENNLPIKKYLRPMPPFDPSRPDPVSVINIPLDPEASSVKPYGS